MIFIHVLEAELRNKLGIYVELKKVFKQIKSVDVPAIYVSRELLHEAV